MMRRTRAVLLIAVSITAAAGIPSAMAAIRSSTAVAAPSADGVTMQDRYGVVRYDTARHRWVVANESPLRSSGLTGVSCSPATGVLTVTFTPLSTIGTFTVDEDDAYAGRYAAGATTTRNSMAITIRKVSTGAAVSCAAPQLRVPGSSLQLWVHGTISAPPTTSAPIPEIPGTHTPTPPPLPSITRPSSNVPTQPSANVATPPPLAGDDSDTDTPSEFD